MDKATNNTNFIDMLINQISPEIRAGFNLKTNSEINFNRAFYIKLGEGGKWAKECIKNNIARIGWAVVKDISLLQSSRWDEVSNLISNDYKERNKTTGATQDFNALRNFVDAKQDDIFITFHNRMMYWCVLDESPIKDDEISKYRQTLDGWHNSSVDGMIKFNIADIPGQIVKIQGFQGTICQFHDKELEILKRRINNKPNEDAVRFAEKRKEMISILSVLINDLQWKDCEILTDLLFQTAGWSRLTLVGENQKLTDIEYLDKINNERYAVQVKAGAGLNDYYKYKELFNECEFRKAYFVVYNPASDFQNFNPDPDCKTQLIYGIKLAEMIFDAGLADWVIRKTN